MRDVWDINTLLWASDAYQLILIIYLYTIDMTPGECSTVYSVDSLYTSGGYEEELDYSTRTGGVCSGMSATFLQRFVLLEIENWMVFLERTVPFM